MQLRVHPFDRLWRVPRWLKMLVVLILAVSVLCDLCAVISRVKAAETATSTATAAHPTIIKNGRDLVFVSYTESRRIAMFEKYSHILFGTGMLIAVLSGLASYFLRRLVGTDNAAMTPFTAVTTVPIWFLVATLIFVAAGAALFAIFPEIADNIPH